MKIIDHYPSPDSKLTTIEIVDKLVESRPTGLKHKNVGFNGLYEDPDLLLVHQEQLLSLLLKMEDLKRLNKLGFKMALEGNSDNDGTSSTDFTKRYIAWGSWLKDVMSTLQDKVVYQYKLSKSFYHDTLDASFNIGMSLDDYYQMLYERAMESFPKRFPFLKPPYPTYRLYRELINGDWGKEVQDLTDEHYQPPQETVKRSISGLDQAIIGSDEHKLSIHQATQSRLHMDLDVHQCNRYRLAFHNLGSAGLEKFREGGGVPWISPRLRRIWHWYAFSSREAGSEEHRDREREVRLAKLRKIRDSKGIDYPPVGASDLLGNSTEESDVFGPDDLWKWKIDVESLMPIMEELTESIQSRQYFALDPVGNHADSEMFFGCQIGFLERQRLNAHGPESRWESTGIFVALRFDPSQGRPKGFFLINTSVLNKRLTNYIHQDAIQELFPNNAYARFIGAHIGEEPGHVSMTTSGESLYLQNGGSACQAYRVYDSKGDINRFFCYDVHRGQLNDKVRRMRNEATVHPIVRALCARKSKLKSFHEQNLEDDYPDSSQ